MQASRHLGQRLLDSFHISLMKINKYFRSARIFKLSICKKKKKRGRVIDLGLSIKNCSDIFKATHTVWTVFVGFIVPNFRYQHGKVYMWLNNLSSLWRQ